MVSELLFGDFNESWGQIKAISFLIIIADTYFPIPPILFE